MVRLVMEQYATTAQTRQLIACRSMMEKPSHRDILADRESKPTVELETFQTKGILFAVRAVLFLRAHGYEADVTKYNRVMQVVDFNPGIAGLPEIKTPECAVCERGDLALYQAQNGGVEGEYYCEEHFDCAGDCSDEHDEFFFARIYTGRVQAADDLKFKRSDGQPKSNGLAHYEAGLPAYCSAGGPYFGF